MSGCRMGTGEAGRICFTYKPWSSFVVTHRMHKKLAGKWWQEDKRLVLATSDVSSDHARREHERRPKRKAK